MSVLTPAQAISLIKAKIHARTNIGVGMCQANAHEIYNIGAGAATAYLAWLAAKYKHRDLALAPIGAWIFMDGGSTLVDGYPAGHVVIKADHKGGVYTPGGPEDLDHWYLTTIAAIRAGWPWHHVVGWTEDNNGVRVPGLEPLARHHGLGHHHPSHPIPHVDPHVQAAVTATQVAVDHATGVKKRRLRHALSILKHWVHKG